MVCKTLYISITGKITVEHLNPMGIAISDSFERGLVL